MRAGAGGGEVAKRKYVRRAQPLPQLEGFVPALEAMLAANAGKPKRARLTYQRMFEELRLAGYRGGYDNVRRHAKAWAVREGERSAAAYVPLKGQVENQVGVMRKRFFAPRPSFKTLADLNGWLADKCIAYAKAQPHPEQTDRCVFEMFEAERPVLMTYRGAFDGFHATAASVSKTCLVRFDRNKYSVKSSAVGRPVDIHAYTPQHVLRLEKKGKFPRRIQVGENRVAWLLHEIESWLAERVAARDSPTRHS